MSEFFRMASIADYEPNIPPRGEIAARVVPLCSFEMKSRLMTSPPPCSSVPISAPIPVLPLTLSPQLNAVNPQRMLDPPFNFHIAATAAVFRIIAITQWISYALMG